MSHRDESGKDQWHPMYMPSRKEVAEKRLALEAQIVHEDEALEADIGDADMVETPVIAVESELPVAINQSAVSNDIAPVDKTDENEHLGSEHLDDIDTHNEQQEEPPLVIADESSGETPILEEPEKSAEIASISPAEVPTLQVDEPGLEQPADPEETELAEQTDTEKDTIAHDSESPATQLPVVDAHTTIPIPQIQDATSVPFRTAGTLDDNPFEMTGEEDVSWIGTATNDPISPSDSPALNAKDGELFGDNSDNFLSQLHQPSSPQTEQLKKQTSHGMFGPEDHEDSFFASPSNLPNQEIKEKKSSITFENEDDSFFAKPQSPLKPIPSPQTLQPSPMSKSAKPKGHMRMTSVFISGGDATNDDFFSSLSPEPQEPSNLLGSQSADGNKDVNDTTELFGKDDETFDLGATESKESDDLFGTTDEQFDIQGGQGESTSAVQAEKEGPKFAFLEEEDDLLLSEDDLLLSDADEEEQSTTVKPQPIEPVQASAQGQVANEQPVTNKYAPQPAVVSQPAKQYTPVQPQINQFSKFSTPSMPSMYSPAAASPYAPHTNQPPQTLKMAKSFMNDHRTGSAYDPPTDITPRPSAQVRRVGSFQPAINTPSPYAPHQPAAAPPVQQKPFYEELPPMPIKAPPARPRPSIDSLAHHQRAPPSIYNKPQTSTSTAQFVPPPNPYESAALSPPAPAQPPLAYGQAAPPVQPYPGVISPQNQHRQLHASQSMNVLQSPMNTVPQPMPQQPVAPPQQPYAVSAPHQSPYAPSQQAPLPQAPVNPYAPQPVVSHVNQYAPAPGTPPSRYAPMVHQNQPASNYGPGQPPQPTSPYQRAAAAQQQYGRYSPRQVSPPISRVKPSPSLPSAPPVGAPRAAVTAAYGDLPSDITQAIPKYDYSPPRNRVQSPPQVIPPGYQTNGRIPESLNLRQNQQLMELQRQQQSQQQLMQAQSQQHRQSIAAPLSASDNEMLTRRQFPVFNWSYSKRAAMVVPPKIAYTGGASAEVRVLQVADVLSTDNLLQKFPAPLVGKSGPIKSKRKELEGWMKDKISALEQKVDNQGLADGVGKRMDHKLLLWKIVHLILASDGSPSKAVADRLAEIRTILVPGIPDLRDGKDDEANFKSVTDMYNAGRSPQSTGGHSEAAFSSDDLRAILGDLEVGNRDGALRKALERKLWAHALVIASSMSTEQWHSTVAEFVREDVRNMDPPASQSLALMYRVFAGAGAESVAELGNQKYGDSSSNWRQHLCLILSNPSAKNPAAIMALGQQLQESGLVEAAQICFVLSGNIGFFGMSDAENQRVEILGANGQSRDSDNILLSEIWEFITFSHAAPELNTPLSCYPHLLIYKLVHASELADLGHLTEAQKVCEGVLTIVKHHDQTKGPKYQREFLQQLENVSQRVNSADASSAGGSGWFGGKLAKPDVNKIWTRFVTGDDEEEVHTSSEKESIFKSLNTAGDRPALSRVQSHADLPGFQYRQQQQHPYSNSSSGSDHYPMGQYAPLNDTIARTQSHSQLPHAYAPIQPPRAMSPYNQVGSQGSSSRAPSRASSVGGFEQQPLQPLQQISQTDIPRPSSGHMPVAPPVSKTPDLPSTSAPLTDTPSPARRTAPASISNSPRGSLQRPVNPYAPVNAATATARARTSNKYAPVAESSNKTTHEAPVSDLPAENVDIYGYMSGSPAITSATMNTASEPYVQEQQTQDVLDEQDVTATTEDDGYQPYEPPSYGYQPPDDEPADYATDDAPSASYFSPMSNVPSFAPQMTGASHSNTPQTIPEEEELEDLGFGNAKKAEEPSEDDNDEKADANKDEKDGKEGKDGTGWFKWLRGGGGGANAGDKQKAIKAKLGGDNEFYFDKELGRWVNPKVAVEETKSKPPPPPKSTRPVSAASTPPIGSGPPSRSASTMNLAPGSAAGTPPPGMPPPGIPKSASVNDLSRAPKPAIPKAASSSSMATTLDDLLGGSTPPPISSGAARKKRSARSKYVDVVQQTQK